MPKTINLSVTITQAIAWTLTFASLLYGAASFGIKQEARITILEKNESRVERIESKVDKLVDGQVIQQESIARIEERMKKNDRK